MPQHFNTTNMNNFDFALLGALSYEIQHVAGRGVAKKWKQQKNETIRD
jgi:hypothetical protein